MSDLTDEAIEKLSKAERKAIRIAHASDQDFAEWAAIEISKAAALKAKQAAKAAKAPAPEVEEDEWQARDDSSLNDYWGTMRPDNRRDLLEQPLSDSYSPQRRKP